MEWMSETLEKRVMNRPAKYGSFPIYSKPKCVKIEKKKSLKFGILLLLYIQGGKSSSFQDFAWLLQKENIFIVWSWLGTHVNHTPLSSTPSRPQSISLFLSLLSHSLFLIRKKPSRIWCFLPSLGRGACSGLITSSSSVGFPKEQSAMGLGVQWLRKAWQI